jgi:Holliday junction resolvase RusA-like endonuclease
MAKPKEARVGFQLTIPIAGKVKPRPRVTKNGTFMPKPYVDWKKEVVTYLQSQPSVKTLQGPVSLLVKFLPDKIEMMIAESPVDRHGRGDIDNLLGGLMDALQDAEVYKNDSQIQRVMVEIDRE